jgi:GTP1/Obg family GTP-binding protein
MYQEYCDIQSNTDYVKIAVSLIKSQCQNVHDLVAFKKDYIDALFVSEKLIAVLIVRKAIGRRINQFVNF